MISGNSCVWSLCGNALSRMPAHLHRQLDTQLQTFSRVLENWHSAFPYLVILEFTLWIPSIWAIAKCRWKRANFCFYPMSVRSLCFFVFCLFGFFCNLVDDKLVSFLREQAAFYFPAVPSQGLTHSMRSGTEQTLNNYFLILQIRNLRNVSSDSKHSETDLNFQLHSVLNSTRCEETGLEKWIP